MQNQTIRDIGKYIPFGRNIDNLFRYGTYKTHYQTLLRANNIREEEMLIIGTIARSGTHYMMLLLANYLAKINDKNKTIGPSDMNAIFPNNWHLHYMSYHRLPLGPFNLQEPKKPNELIDGIGLKEITRSHSLFQRIYWKKSPVLHLYRNPLDYAVSLYYYKHKKRLELANRCRNPNEVLKLKFGNYVAMYKSYQNAAREGKYKVLRISYENLIMKPEFYLTAVLQWLGHEPELQIIEDSLLASSIQNVRRAEKIGEVMNPEASNLVGSFINSGQIGQWKKHFNVDDYKRWKKAFRGHEIELDSFILE